MTTWFEAHPEVTSLRVAVADLNGQPRGKRLPVRRGDAVLNSGVRMPLSAINLDVTGADIHESPLVFETGDADGVLRPTGRGPVAVPWSRAPAALVPLWTFREDGRAFDGDPRHALAAVLRRYDAKGWEPIVATELEFYVAETGSPMDPGVGPEILSLQTLDRYDAFFTELYAAADEMGIAADAAISEAGPGQFEVNLDHSDAMRAADDTWLFKLLVKGLAPRHGLGATFMAKPIADASGNGLHMHFSVVDQDHSNIFDDGTSQGSAHLAHAVAGCLRAMAGSTLVFAPHGPSYDRFVDAAHAPTGIGWGYENRTAAIRIPGGAPIARRIEHRVSGGDANPYLLMAAVLGAALNGIEDEAPPPPPVVGNAYAADLPKIPTEWTKAVDRFETDAEIQRIFPAELIRNLVMTKRQELALAPGLDPDTRLKLYQGLV